MKNKIFLSLLILTALGTALQGQQNVQKGWMMGAFGFVGNAGFAYPAIEAEANAGPAYQMGSLAQYRFGKRLALRTGLAFSSAKGSASGSEPDFNFPGQPTIYGDKYEARFHHTDLLLPIEGLLNLGKQGDRGMYALLGATLGVALKRQARQEIYRSGLGWVTTQLHDNHAVVSIYNNIGLGCLFPVGPKTRLFVQLSGSSNALSNLILSISNRKERAVVNTYGLGFGILGRLT
jgi:hypothetical protein